ncbi:MAG: hypothetical protein AAFP19_20145 [Bacteroidota bacterium]
MDKFDDIWKNSFNDESFPIADWNTPDEEVWEGIAPNVPQQNNRKYWFLWSLVLISLLIMAYLLLGAESGDAVESNHFSSNQLSTPSLVAQHLVPEVSGRTIRMASKEEDVNMAAFSNIDVVESPSKEIELEQRNSDPIANEVTRKQTLESVFIASPKKSVPKDVNLPLAPSVEGKAIEAKSNLQFENDKQAGYSTGIGGASIINGTPVIPTLQLVVSSSDKVEIGSHPFPVPASHLDKGKQDQKRWSLSLLAGASLWQHQISNQYTNDLSPFDFKYSDNWGWMNGVQLNWSVHPMFEAQVGLQYERVVGTSGHNSSLVYDVTQEDQAGNDYSQSLATPYGLSEASFRFSRNQALNNDEVNLLVDINSEHEINNWSVPIGLAIYPLAGNANGKWKPQLNLGFGVNYLSSISNRIQHIATNHEAIDFDDKVSSKYADSSIQQWHYDLRMGLGLQYELNSGWQLSANGQWLKGLNPIFQQDKYETRINRFQLSLGINKRL